MNEDFEKFKEQMSLAFKQSNFFDSQYMIEDLKKKYSEKEILVFLRKELLLRKKNKRLMDSAIKRLKDKYMPRDDYIWEEAISYVTHKYQRGENVFFYYDGINSGQIKRLTKTGYKIFIGRKLGIEPDISFGSIICHISNTKKILEELEKNKNEKKN